MKGFTKAIKRTPHLMTSKVGLASKSHDAEYDELNRKFTALEKYAEKLLKDSSTFRDAVKNMLLSGAEFGKAFYTLFQPIGAEYDLETKHPQAAATLVNISQYQTHMDELRETLTPEIELIDSRIVGPANEFQTVLKSIRKNMTKRDHKLVDYDRHNNTYTKLKDKKEKTLKDEQSLFKVEQDFEAAAADYEYYNNAMKEELPRFFQLGTQFITPLFHSFYYMQLNVFYLMLDKLQSFAEGKYDISPGAAPVEDNYAAQLTDAADRLEALSIRKGPLPSARVLQQSRQSPLSSSSSRTGGLAAGAPSKGSLGRSPSAMSKSSAAASPPPPAYTPAQNGGLNRSTSGLAAAGKRAPPPPPTKPKPGAAAGKSYVTALYDYAATADGDLSFSAGDRIEVVERTGSTEDWWTGILNGKQGVFPGNYVQDE